MDFLDPKLERRHRHVLMLGYGLVAIAIGLVTLLLLYQAYGFGIDRQGKITQTGFVFVSSQPKGAGIKFNGQAYKNATNTRVTILAGAYTMQIDETGYRTWQHRVVVNGGDVQHYDYPFLFPKNLKTTPIKDLSGAPSVATQSPDKRWLLLGEADKSGSFLLYDLKSPDKPVATEISLPADAFTAGDGDQSWTLVEWSADNQHVLLQHDYTANGSAAHEFVLVNRNDPSQSISLTKTLNLSANDLVNMYDAKVAQFYILDQDAKTLARVNTSDDGQIAKIDHVLAFKPYGSDRLLYVTDTPPSGKTVADQVTAVLQVGQKTYALRTLPAGASSYVLNLAQYGGDWYVGVGASSENAVYIFRNPESEALVAGSNYPAPWRRMSIQSPSYLSFSNNTQFLMAENGQDFVVYDAENKAQFRYHSSNPLDQPQLHATWMDGDRLMYTSGGNAVVFDYDYKNKQTLVASGSAYLPFFSSNYRFLYTIRPGESTAAQLTSTPLVVTP